MDEHHGDGHVVSIERRHGPVVQPRHGDLAGVERIHKLPAHLAAFVECERLAVCLILNHDVAALRPPNYRTRAGLALRYRPRD